MKFRSGFVSNSSSSSYVVITTKRAADEAFAKLDPYIRAVAEDYLGGGSRAVGGVDIYAVAWMSGNVDSFECFCPEEFYEGKGKVPEGEWGAMSGHEAMDLFNEALGENKFTLREYV